MVYHRKQPLIVLVLIAVAYTKVDFSWKSKSEHPSSLRWKIWFPIQYWSSI